MVMVLSVFGVFAVYSTAHLLWTMWTTDPLTSIGAFIPLVSTVLILRVWRSLGWEMRGTWWGLALLALTIAMVHFRDHALLELILMPSWTMVIPPFSMVALGYATGIVLLFGGPRLFRAALFPIALIFFVKPVPHVFNLWVDLPLQHVSALITRGFAHALGQQLTNDQLRLMFTPDFGMFIAPGCNGIRGAVTMGFIALIAGYIYKFRPSIHAMFVVAAVLLGYVFNFVRLCVLVLYYIVALHIPWLQSRATMGDYIIGACLFFLATVLLFTAIRHFSPTHDLRPPELATTPSTSVPNSFRWRWIAFLLLTTVGSVSYVRAIVQQHNTPTASSDTLGTFPQTIGNYTLERRWNETLTVSHIVAYYWATYRPSGGGAPVSVGVSPILGVHDSIICRTARGEDWLWHGALIFPSADQPASFTATFYNDGASQFLEATTLCTAASCGQYSTGPRFGFVYSHPDARALLTLSPTRPMPVLLRTDTPDTQLSAETARTQLTANLRSFVSAAHISAFSQPYRQP